MPREQKFTAEQIIGKLREAEVELARGKTVPDVLVADKSSIRPFTAHGRSAVRQTEIRVIPRPRN